MSMFDIIPYGNSETRRLKKLTRDSTRISRGQTNLSLSYKNLTTASTKILSTITALQARDFSEHKKTIDGLQIPEDYKEGLNAELLNSRQKAIDTLKPLHDKAEKLRGNMVVTQEKSLHYLAVIKAQQEVAKAGQIQVQILTTLQETGEVLGNEIETLLEECERINSVTDAAVAPFRALSGGREGSFLDVNPLVKGV